MATLARAIAIAAQAHERQQDRAGKPYILHPLRIMFKMQTEVEMTVAILHDVVEDTDWTLDALRSEGFSDEIVTAVDCLTKRDGEPYEHLIERAKHNAVALRVKMADLEDNMTMQRMKALHPNDLERLQRYHEAWTKLRIWLASTTI
jgi:(p)ppGpp synthase/HD superfamily hydrolase